MKKYSLLFIALLQGIVVFGQDPLIKAELPSIMPPSPTVAALMKFEEIPVSNYTGKPNISIPLYSCSTLSKDINLDISLNYNPSSVAAEEHATDVGLGWSLIAGGTISRTVRGLPDEYNRENKLGIYHNTDPNHHNNYYSYMEILENGISSSQDFYTLEEFQWEAHEKGKYDAEHDLWQYNFMGYTGRFYIKKNATTGALEVKNLDKVNLKIESTYDTTNTIHQFTPINFTVYDDKGYRFVFDVVEVTDQNSFSESIGCYSWCDLSDSALLPVMETYYSRLTQASSTIEYKSAFHLTKVYDNNDNLLLDLLYNEGNNYKEIIRDKTVKESRITNVNEAGLLQSLAISVCSPVGVLDGPHEAGKIEPKVLNSFSQRRTIVKKLSTINVEGKARIDFKFIKGREDENFHRPDSSYVFKGITVRDWDHDSIKKIRLTQNYSEVLYKRMTLTKVTESNYENDEVLEHNLYYKANISSQKVGKDYWGYFNLWPNGFMGGHYREVNPSFASTDVLQKMSLPTGGCIVFDYESNSYSYESNTQLTNFDDNPNNWNHTSTGPFTFLSNNILGTLQELNYSATEDQKITIFPDAASLGENGGLKLTKDGVDIPMYLNLVCPSEIPDCGIDLTLEAGSQYELKMWWVSPNETGTASAEVVYHTKKTSGEPWLYGGGIRIKRIGYFDKSEVPQNFYEDYISNSLTYIPKKEKNFNYNFHGTSISSGSLAFPKPVYNYQIEIDPGFHIGFIEFPYILSYDVITEFNNLSTIKTQGADIGYKNVSVYETGNGKTEYTYTSPITVPEPDFAFSVRPPFLQSLDLDYKKGLLTLEEIFDNSSKKISKTIMSYEFDEYTEETGMKFFSHPINCPDSHRYTNYDHFKYCSDNPATCTSIFWPLSHWGGDASDFIGHHAIVEAFGWAKLTSKITENYFYEGISQKTVQTNETFAYNTLNKKISEQTVTNSLGDIMKTKYFYHTGNSIHSQNRISEIEKIETYKNESLLSSSKINYTNTFAGNVSYLPQTILTSKGIASLENRIKYNAYDNYGHPLEVQQENGTVISYLWGYNQSQPIAKIENATNAQIKSALGITDLNLVSEANLVTINNLRTNTSFANAMITTYTYIPLVGITSVTDPKGDKMTYIYDDFNRLKEVRDKNNNILSENEYHYRSQN